MASSMESSPVPDTNSERLSDWTRPAVIGLVGGIVAAIAMAMYAMTAAATYQDTGFFTPLYHIGSAFGTGSAADAMKTSMDQAAGGDLYYFTAGPAFLGVVIHAIAGAGWGALFGLLVRALRGARAWVVPGGVVYGLVVMLAMSYIVLPATAAVFDSGPPIRDMPSMVGWGTFTVEHAIFGLVLGLATLPVAARIAAEEVRGEQSTRDRVTPPRVPVS
jgi:hypothetical protein